MFSERLITATILEPATSLKAGPDFFSVTSPHPINPQLICFIVAKIKEKTVENIKTGGSQFTLHFWVFAYSYVNRVFEGLSIEWKGHTTVQVGLNSNGNYYEKVNQIKLKAYNLTKDADKKDKILKKKGGIERDPQLGQKIAYLLIDSIEAKLSILNTVEN